MKNLYTLLLTLLFPALAFAQTPGGYKIGQVVQDFTLSATDGKAATLSDHGSAKAVVVVFVNRLCPNDRIYAQRLQKLAATYSSQGVHFLYIQPTLSMENGGTAAKALAQEVPAGPNPPQVLIDPRHQVTNQFGATKVPEVFVLQPGTGGFHVRYKGAIDDNPQLEAGVREAYLRQALDALLANRPVANPEERPFGCMIKRL
ncbi:MAG: redoxin domain-containing protein [Adhaeribacter sp.]